MYVNLLKYILQDVLYCIDSVQHEEGSLSVHPILVEDESSMQPQASRFKPALCTFWH